MLNNVKYLCQYFFLTKNNKSFNILIPPGGVVADMLKGEFMKKLLSAAFIIGALFLTNAVFACEKCKCENNDCACACHKVCDKDCDCGCHNGEKCACKDCKCACHKQCDKDCACACHKVCDKDCDCGCQNGEKCVCEKCDCKDCACKKQSKFKKLFKKSKIKCNCEE